MKEKVLVSACLLGVPCRYDGASKPCEKVQSHAQQYDLIPICPEEMGGLPTPRLPCEIRDGKVIRSDGMDCTEFYLKGARKCLNLAQKNKIKLAILKEKSPSCGSHLRYDGSFSGKMIQAQGITAKLLSEHGIRVISEEEI